jgi:hypothetical protein
MQFCAPWRWLAELLKLRVWNLWAASQNCSLCVWNLWAASQNCSLCVWNLWAASQNCSLCVWNLWAASQSQNCGWAQGRPWIAQAHWGHPILHPHKGEALILGRGAGVAITNGAKKILFQILTMICAYGSVTILRRHTISTK